MNYNLILFLLIIVILSNIGECLCNGDETISGNLKHQIYLKNKAFSPCSGIILDEWHIITAAHCVYRNKPNELLVVAGSIALRRGIVELQAVQEIHIHKDFNRFPNIGPGERSKWLNHQSPNDIAILTLEVPLLLGKYSQPVILPSEIVDTGPCTFISCELAHWRILDIDEMEPHLHLLFSPVAIVPVNHCIKSGMKIYRNELCVIDMLGNLALNSFDHGGGLMCNGVLAGILLSTGSSFVATDVNSFLPFIDEVKQKDKVLYSLVFPGFAAFNS